MATKLSNDIRDLIWRAMDKGATKEQVNEAVEIAMLTYQKPVEVTGKTPDEWCSLFGVQVTDPDGWNRNSKDWQAEWNRMLTRDEFLDKYRLSTVQVVDPDKFKAIVHLL